MSACTSQKTDGVSFATTSRLMLLRETTAVYTENQKDRTNSPWRRNTVSFYTDVSGTHTYQYNIHVPFSIEVMSY
jgi:hypothetical protein